jgi:hypothetical protein
MVRLRTFVVGASAALVLVLHQESGSQFVQSGQKLVGSGATGRLMLGSAVAISADGSTAAVGGIYDSTLVGAVWIYSQTNGVWNQQGTKLVGSEATGTSYQGWALSLSADGNTLLVGGSYDSSFEGAVWVFTRSGDVWSQQGKKLVGSGSVGITLQGSSVSLSADGNTAVVGGPADSSRIGAIWVFTRSGNVWSQQGSKLVGSGSVATPLFGISVSISADGNTVIAGGDGDNNSLGAAWVFTRSSGVWNQQGVKLVGSGSAGPNPNQGSAVSLSADGNIALVGGSGDGSGVGAAWVFVRTSGVWAQQGSKIVGNGNVDGSNQGSSVSLSADGSTALVGGSNDSSGVGATWVFTQSGGIWNQRGDKLVGRGAVGAGSQGRSVALSADGDIALVGAPNDDRYLGAAWTFKQTTGVWGQMGEKLRCTGSSGLSAQGSAVALSRDGSTAILGGPYDSTIVGAFWVFTSKGDSWAQQGTKLVGSGARAISLEGCAVSLSADGNTALVGGSNDSSVIGAVWVFTRSGGTWTQQGSKLVGAGGVGIAFQGSSVALSADGNTAIEGGPADNSHVGAAWVFTRTGSEWIQQGSKLVGAGISTIQPFAGTSVSLSADGNTAAIGGPEDSNGVGAVWIFSRSAGIWTQEGGKLVGGGALGASNQGTAVALSDDGNTVIVGGPFDSSGTGAAWIFTRSGGAWSQQRNKLVGTDALGPSFQGTSVALSSDGNTAVVGGSGDNGSTGATWVFARANGVWSQVGAKLVGAGLIQKAGQGQAVSVSGDGATVLIGGPGDNAGVGGAWVFRQTGTSITKTPWAANRFSLEQNFPNPFNPTTTIRYVLSAQSHITLSVYNTLGQLAASLVDGNQDAGIHEVIFDGGGLSSGIYFYRLQGGGFIQTKKIVILR